MLFNIQYYSYFAIDSESEEEDFSPTKNDLTEYRNNYKDDELVSLCLRPYRYSTYIYCAQCFLALASNVLT